jgi:hypothetical protein
MHLTAVHTIIARLGLIGLVLLYHQSAGSNVLTSIKLLWGPSRAWQRIFAVDLNPRKFDMAIQLGATDCLNPSDFDKPIQQVS